jgi:hypothetical protein
MSNNINANSPAFPCVPIQDNFGRLIAAIPGMSKLEYFTLQIFLRYNKDILAAPMALTYQEAINEAEMLLWSLDEHFKNQNSKNETTEAKILSID